MNTMHAIHELQRSGHQREAGLSLLEVVITSVLLLSVSGIFATAIFNASDFTAHNIGAANLQEVGRKTLQSISRDISRTGRTERAFTIALPHVFSLGQPHPDLAPAFEHDVAALMAIVGSFPPPPPVAPAGANPPPFVAPGNETEPQGIREIVLALPGDQNGDGSAVDSTTGQIEWDSELVGYLLIPGDDDLSTLVRRTWRDDGSVFDERIRDGVAALTFDTSDTKPTLPRNAVEIHLHLERRTNSGHLQTAHVFTTVYMRNSES